MIAAPPFRSQLSAFGPRSINGLVLQLNANQPGGAPFDGDQVATWRDLSGNGFDATQATASKRPTWKANGGANGGPSIRFDGVDDVLTLSGSGLGLVNAVPGMTIFIVHAGTMTTGDSGGKHVFSATVNSNGSSSRFSFRRDLTTTGNYSMIGRRLDTDGLHQVSSSAIYTAGVFDVAVGRVDYKNGSTYTVKRNGVVIVGPTSLGSSGLSEASNSGGIGIGSRPDSSVGFVNGDIMDILVYTRALADAEIVQLERWLATKRGLSVA